MVICTKRERFFQQGKEEEAGRKSAGKQGFCREERIYTVSEVNKKEREAKKDFLNFLRKTQKSTAEVLPCFEVAI